MIAIVVIHLLCSSIYIFMGISTFFKDSKSKINRIFCITCMNLSFWAFMTALMTASTDASTAAFYKRLTTISWTSFYYEFLYCSILLTKKEYIFKKLWRKVLLFLPVVISFYLYFFKPYLANDLVRITYGWAILVPKDKGLVWDWFFDVYYIPYTLASIWLIFVWGKQSLFKREKKQSKIITVSLIVTMIVASITDIVLPELGIIQLPQITIIYILIGMAGIYYSIIRYSLMSLTIEGVVSDVMKVMNEGLIILNQDDVIISANKGALKLLDYEENDIVGKYSSFVFSGSEDIYKLNKYTSCEIYMKTKFNEKIPVLISISALLDKCGDKLGTVLIFQNLFEIKQIQNKLEKAYDNLEKRVQERTCELSNVNMQLENEMYAKIAREEEITKLAFSDQLTGLSNRRSFNDKLNEIIYGAVQDEKSIAIMFMDLDNFKMINDTLGHAQGDELLKKVAGRLKSTLRENDIIARVGGDEFLILIYEPTSREYIEKVCENIIRVIKEPFELDKNEIYITTSIGVSVYPQDGKDVETLIKNADIAMYESKQSGKGRFELCNQTMKNSLDHVMRLTNDLYRALELNELELYYQPQVDTTSGIIVGAEALLRWNHPEFGMISPAVFIPIAEKTGLIVAMGEWVLRNACMQTKAWQDAGLPRISMGVNLSVNQIQNHKIVRLVSRILAETGLDPKDLELEITENIFMKDIDYIAEILTELKNLNVRIAIDDFGTDYSSLSYLKQLPLDRIKIAKCFVDGIDKNITDESIISAIIILGKKLGLDLIAEGVETDIQLKFLKTQLCDEIQGFYFFKPMKAIEIEKILLGTELLTTNA